MPTYVTVRDAEDPRLADYRALKDVERLRERSARTATFIAEGAIVVRQLLGSRFAVRSVLTTPAKRDRLATELERLGADTAVYVAEPAVLRDIVGFQFHRGVLACASRGGVVPIGEVLRDSTSLVVLEGVSNPDNVGAIFRVASALGGARPGVLLGPGCADPLWRKAVRVSMGHVLRVAFADAAPWPGVLSEIHDAGFGVVALALDPGAIEVARLGARARARPALVLGAEGDGLTTEALAEALRVGSLARIGMRTGVDSLNVTTAASIALYEVFRGSTESGPGGAGN